MTTPNLRLVQLNIWKSRAGMEALINDSQTQNLDILLIQEPPLTAYSTHVNHSAWHLYQSTCQEDTPKKRSLLYVNRRISTASHRQIKCNHPDVTAVKMWTMERQMLIFSIYVPTTNHSQPMEEVSIQAMLEEIETCIQQAIETTDKPTTIIMAGDFNRHHPMWSKNRIYHVAIEHAEELVTFFHKHGLQPCLPRGTSTYWSMSYPGSNSTIDLTVTDTPESLIKCHLYHDHYGSDHRAVYSEWSLDPSRNAEREPRRAYDRADWKQIGESVQAQIAQTPPIHTEAELEGAVAKLITCTTFAVDQHTPMAKPSPYSKRWFSPELKEQQREVNRARRKWQESCAEKGRQDPMSLILFGDMRTKRRAWTRAIEKAKATHWKDFLDSAGEGHLWKAASYMRPRESYGNIPPLKQDKGETADNTEKARLFMRTFFPRMAPPEDTMEMEQREEIPWTPITEQEVYRALRAAKPMKAPGEDGIPMLVWRQLWQWLRTEILRIFTASVNLGYYPEKWKRARIVVLRKPGKPDYTLPGAYRPISLLNTLGKVLEAVMAKRLSYYAEEYGLLPNTQFGGRPGRNPEQALLVLRNAIDRAWLASKVITLVAFDLKGAFNGVSSNILDRQLKAKGIPTKLRAWVASFMEGRSASISFDDFESARSLLENAGLAQGSPLSPILFIFFNSNLVNQRVDYHGGASAFIDDYFRWRAGKSAEENIRKLQEEDIPRIEQWAKLTGSCFAAEKTELIHFTRKKREQTKGRLVIQGATIEPSATAKLLGVVCDQELRWKEHVQQAVNRATKVNIALAGLRHLRPGQMRQVYQACVTPIMDYASTVWHNPLKDKRHLRVLDTVQRSALIRILSAFRTVATATVEVETYTLPTHLRLKQRAQRVIVNLCTLPRDHPIQDVISRARRRRDNVGSQPRFPLAESMKTMRLEQLDGLETIDPKPMAPWKPPGFLEIDIEPDREKAKDKATALQASSNMVVFSDASGQNNQLGAATVILDHNKDVVESRQLSIGSMANWSVYAAELIGIFYAISLVLKIVSSRPRTPTTSQQEPATILCDSMSALQAIRNPGNKSGQRIIHANLQAAAELKARGIPLRLQWIPGHCDDPGNDAADKLARMAVGLDKMHPFPRLVSQERASIRKQILKEWEHEWKTCKKGSHLRRIDPKLPAIRTRRLYDSLPRNQAYLLTQLRTGHCWLAPYGKLHGHREDDKCECGAKETVTHVLLDCSKLRIPRQKLRRELGEAFGDIPAMLGGKGETSHVKAVLDFAEASQRFRSRGPRGPQRQNSRQTATTGP